MKTPGAGPTSRPSTSMRPRSRSTLSSSSPRIAISRRNLRKAGRTSSARDQRTLEEAKLNVVRRFGEAARTISEQRRQGQDYPAEPAYLHLYRIGCLESSYPIRLACAQEIGAGGDEAFDALAGALGPPVADRSNGHATTRAERSGTAVGELPPRGGHSWPGGGPGARGPRVGGGGHPGLARAVARRVGDGAKITSREQEPRAVAPVPRRAHAHQAEPDLRLSLEVALAQGFKHAANRRRHHPHARPEARAYLAEQAREMLRDSHFWFTRLTLVHALCLWSLPDGQPGPRDRRDDDHRALVSTGSPPGQWARASIREGGEQARRPRRWKPGSPSASSGSTRAAWPLGSDPVRRTREHRASTTSGFRRPPGGPRSTRAPSSSSPTCCCC